MPGLCSEGAPGATLPPYARVLAGSAPNVYPLLAGAQPPAGASMQQFWAAQVQAVHCNRLQRPEQILCVPHAWLQT